MGSDGGPQGEAGRDNVLEGRNETRDDRAADARTGALRKPGAAGFLALFALGLAITACSNEAPPELPKGLACVDDSAGCIAQRTTALAELNNDKSRAWIHQPVPAAAYASGVRLFAYKQKKRELSCPELSVARKEADAGPAVLRGPDGKHLTTTQIARGVMLAQEVSRELGAEAKRRCKA